MSIDVIVEWLLSILHSMVIDAMQGVATAIWVVEKLLEALSRGLTNDLMWGNLTNTIMASLRNYFPTILQNTVFGSSGLFFLALSLAGILLIISFGGEKKIADPAHVLFWGAIVSVLFVRSFTGYDLIAGIEGMRRTTSNVPLTVIAPSRQLSDLITIPMRASSGDLSDAFWSLPTAFQNEYYPEPSQFESKTATLFFYPFTLQVEPLGARLDRQSRAVTGLFMSVLTLIPATAMVIYGVINGVLNASVFFLILFFLTTLPIGFFSFGQQLVQSIVAQYMRVWAVTLLAGTFMGLLLGMQNAFLTTAPSGPMEMIAYLSILLVLMGVLYMIAQMAWQTSKATTNFLNSSLRDIASGQLRLDRANIETMGETGQRVWKETKEKVGQIANLAVVGATAYATGGTSAAVGAVGGDVLQKVDPKMARDLALVSRRYAGEDSVMAQNFAVAALSNSTIPTIGALWAVNRRENEADKPNPLPKEDALAKEAFGRASSEKNSPDALSQLGSQAKLYGIDEQKVAILIGRSRKSWENSLLHGHHIGDALLQETNEAPELHHLAPDQKQLWARTMQNAIETTTNRHISDAVWRPQAHPDLPAVPLIEAQNVARQYGINQQEWQQLLHTFWRSLDISARTHGDSDIIPTMSKGMENQKRWKETNEAERIQIIQAVMRSAWGQSDGLTPLHRRQWITAIQRPERASQEFSHRSLDAVHQVVGRYDKEAIGQLQTATHEAVFAERVSSGAIDAKRELVQKVAQIFPDLEEEEAKKVTEGAIGLFMSRHSNVLPSSGSARSVASAILSPEMASASSDIPAIYTLNAEVRERKWSPQEVESVVSGAQVARKEAISRGESAEQAVYDSLQQHRVGQYLHSGVKAKIARNLNLVLAAEPEPFTPPPAITPVSAEFSTNAPASAITSSANAMPASAESTTNMPTNNPPTINALNPLETEETPAEPSWLTDIPPWEELPAPPVQKKTGQKMPISHPTPPEPEGLEERKPWEQPLMLPPNSAESPPQPDENALYPLIAQANLDIATRDALSPSEQGQFVAGYLDQLGLNTEATAQLAEVITQLPGFGTWEETAESGNKPAIDLKPVLKKLDELKQKGTTPTKATANIAKLGAATPTTPPALPPTASAEGDKA